MARMAQPSDRADGYTAFSVTYHSTGGREWKPTGSSLTGHCHAYEWNG
jgi:hypothetical protein